jgi:hypothetical protein
VTDRLDYATPHSYSPANRPAVLSVVCAALSLSIDAAFWIDLPHKLKLDEPPLYILLTGVALAAPFVGATSAFLGMDIGRGRSKSIIGLCGSLLGGAIFFVQIAWFLLALSVA